MLSKLKSMSLGEKGILILFSILFIFNIAFFINVFAYMVVIEHIDIAIWLSLNILTLQSCMTFLQS